MMTFDVPVGDKRDNVKIWHNRFGHHGYVVFYNGRDMGYVIKRADGSWENSLTGDLTTDDFQLLVQMIEEHPESFVND